MLFCEEIAIHLACTSSRVQLAQSVALCCEKSLAAFGCPRVEHGALWSACRSHAHFGEERRCGKFLFRASFDNSLGLKARPVMS